MRANRTASASAGAIPWPLVTMFLPGLIRWLTAALLHRTPEDIAAEAVDKVAGQVPKKARRSVGAILRAIGEALERNEGGR